MGYSILKLVHIGALVLWLGPALGAWIVLKAVEREEVNSVTAKVNRAFFAMITLEHIAFFVLLATGLYMAMMAGWFATTWVHQKLLIIGLIIIPLEVVDIVLGNWLAAKASRNLYNGQKLSRREQRWLVIYHGPFTKLAIVIIPLSVILIMYLAVSKSPLF